MPQENAVLDTQDLPAGRVPPPSPPGVAAGGFAGDGREEPGGPQGSEPAPRSPWLWMALLLLIGIAMPFAPISNAWVALIVAPTLSAVYAFIIVRFASDVTRNKVTVVQHLGLLLLAVALWWVFDSYVVERAMEPIRHMRMAASLAHQPPPVISFALQFDRYLAITLTGLLLLVAAMLGGAMVARLIDEPNMLAPICGLIMIIDVWGVLFGGIVSQLMSKAPALSARAMSHGTAIGSASATAHNFRINLPDIGAGDFLFLGLLFAAMHSNRMNVRGAQRWIIPLVTLALWGVLFGMPALPGLLFIGLGAAIPNRAWFRFTTDEKKALAVAGVFVLILSVGLGLAAPYIVAAAQSGEPQPR